MVLEDLNDESNGLLLYEPVGWAFCHAKVYIEVNLEGMMTFRLFDQDLRDMELSDKAARLQNKRGYEDQCSEAEKNLCGTFGDLDE